METAVEPTKKGKCKVECKNKERFILIQKENGKAMYHTKIMMWEKIPRTRATYKMDNKKPKIITIVSINDILDKIFYMYVKFIFIKTF
ncbi:hypothetical protein [Borreliella japonica]|uniref:hypothetical protein n=1 Tax=Borreliella japonica TaxID=34095 RepID=UPI003AEFC0CE